MIKNVIISRKNDALFFYEMDYENNDNNLLIVKKKAYELLKNMNSKKKDGTYGVKSQPYKIYYHINNNIVYLIITHKNFSKFILLFFKNLNDIFINWLKIKFETEEEDTLYSKLQKIDQNFFFNFEPMNKIKHEWEYIINNQINSENLYREIVDINKSMIENIYLFLERDRHLNAINSLSKSVLTSAKKLEKAARNTRIKTQYNIYTFFIGISIIIFLLILFKIL